MEESDFATTAAYFQYGLEAGILDAEQARDWALAIVEVQRTPPLEVVEILASRTHLDLAEALKAVPGIRDVQLAGRWLLHTLNRRLATDSDVARTVIRQALQVARSTGLDEDTQFAFDSIDDLFGLALSDTFGTVEGCRTELLAVLSRCEVTPRLQLS
jgi:hypothetical protein